MENPNFVCGLARHKSFTKWLAGTPASTGNDSKIISAL